MQRIYSGEENLVISGRDKRRMIFRIRKGRQLMNQKLLHTPEGVRDIYGREYARKLAVEELLHRQFASYGFEDIQTPIFEYFDVFSKEIGTTTSKDLYKFFDKEGDTLVLRPDFTPSIARCAAKYFMEENVPIRFSYLGNTFTNTSNLQGKLKEVTQMGVELINEPSIEADAEMISLMVSALVNTGLTKFQVSVGQVEYFKGICEEAGLEEETVSRLRECISAKNLFAAEDLLLEKKVSSEHRQVLLRMADMFGGIDFLAEARKMAGNERSVRAVEHLEELYEVLKLYGCEKYISFDLGMLSKYKYYTGVIFKVYTYGVGDAIVKGGRYDTLLKHFGKDAPAIGFAIVTDDLLEALNRQKIEIPLPKARRILTYRKENYKEVLEEVLRLRQKGIAVALEKEQEKAE